MSQKPVVPPAPVITAVPSSGFKAVALPGRVVLVHETNTETTLSEFDLTEAETLIVGLNLAYSQAKGMLEGTREDLRR